LNSLSSLNVGGYSIPVGSGTQLATLPWTGLDQIKIVFSEDVVVVTVHGVKNWYLASGG
jgi:hypothetical protein